LIRKRFFVDSAQPPPPHAPQRVDPFGDPLRRAASLSYLLLKETDPGRLRKRIVKDTRRLLQADAVRLLEPAAGGGLQLTERAGLEPLPESALLLEPALAAQAVAAGKSLISDHPRLYPELRPLASRCSQEQVLVHALLVRANGQTLGVAAAHWVERPRPGYEERSGAYLFWDNVGLALAMSNERERVDGELERLRRLALEDELTGLPNQRALHEELEPRLAARAPAVVILYVDFDGMREANNALGYEAGGDFLIQTVGRSIPGLLLPGELAARLHRAGDEFACVLHAGEDARARAAELEIRLDRIAVPKTHEPFYGGASVGWATSDPGEAPAALIARAAKSMQDRKRRRRRDGKELAT
jgi:diguanylate cyclase